MKIRLDVFVFLAIAIFLCGCTKSNDRIDASQIVRVTVFKLETNESSSVESDQITVFIAAYHESIRSRDDVGTTHPFRVDILLKDGSTISIWGGVGDFCTVQLNGEQFNIRSDSLGKWFGQFE